MNDIIIIIITISLLQHRGCAGVQHKGRNVEVVQGLIMRLHAPGLG